MEFTPINTQEEFDEAIKERIARLERKHQDAIAALDVRHKDDLEKLKEQLQKDHEKELGEIRGKLKAQDDNAAKVADLEKQAADLGEKLKAEQESSAKKIAEKEEKIRAYETDSAKTRIAHETGLPFESVGFLQGNDEDSIRKSAEALKGIIGVKVAPLAGDDPDKSGKDGGHVAAMRNMLKGLNLEGE